MDLNKRYRHKKANCCRCGMSLEVSFDDESLGDYFVMDINGNFYCADCDEIFCNGDERIYTPEEEL